MYSKNIIRSGLLVLCLVCGAGPAWAQAFCSLRDPVRSIEALVPEGERYRSIVVDVDSDLRKEIFEQSGLTLHFRELGKHTLYHVPTSDGRTLLVHVRPEATRWGIVEFAWLISKHVDGTFVIEGMHVQRCHTQLCDSPLVATATQGLIGRSEDETLALLEKTRSDESRTSRQDQLEHELKSAVFASGVKTQRLTRILVGNRL